MKQIVSRTLLALTGAALLGLLAFLPKAALSQAPTSPGLEKTPSGYETCGAVNTGLGATNSVDASVAETCFSRAYAACQPATLSANFGGIDAGARRTFFTVKEPSRCLVVDVVENYVIPSLTNDRVYLCNSVQQTSTGLVVMGCGQDGDVVLPAKPESHSNS